MNNKIKNILLSILRFVPLVLCIAFMAIYLFSGQEVTAESLLDYAPENPLHAAIFLILLYAFKSLTVFFPIIVLNVLGGFLFEPIHALIINAIGVIVELAVPYCIGRASGAGFADKMRGKYPKLNEFIGENSDNNFFMSFFLRVISCLPGDAISMYFGACKTPFGTYLLGSFLGTIPGVITATLLGTSITDPGSPMFWISIVLTVGLSVTSFIFYLFWKRAKNKEGGQR